MPVVSFMPYFPNERVNRTVGRFSLWNWWNFREQLVEEGELRNFLDRYFGLYVRSDGQTEPRITVLAVDGLGAFPEEADLPKEDVARFTSALMACHLFCLPSQSNAGWMACSSDNFIAFYHSFNPSGQNPGVAFVFGSYVKLGVFGSWDYLRFTTPQYMPTSTLACSCEESLLANLAAIAGDQSEQVERIFRSFDWLGLAFANYDGLEYRSRVVSMATAFETLLDLPEKFKGQCFSETVNSLLPPNNLPIARRVGGRRGRQISDNKVGWWCREFYDLRSKIVHGEQVSPGELSYNGGAAHLRIALSVFEECLRGLFVRMGRMTGHERLIGFVFRRAWRDYLNVPDNVWCM